MKVIMLMFIMILELSAVDRNEVLGKWKAVSKSSNNGTLTIEKEYLNLNTDRSFTIVLLVSVQKGEAFIKDLKIKGSGIWKIYENTLVAVVNKIEVPSAKEVYLISNASLRNLAENFKRRLQDEPIRILKIKSIDRNSLMTENENLLQTHYSRY